MGRTDPRVTRALVLVVVTCGWVLVAAMSVVALIRLFRSETDPTLIGIQAIAAWLLIPAYPIAILALLRRRWALGAVAAVLVVAQATWMAGAIGWHGSQPAPANSAEIRLVTANVLLDNPKIQALGDDLAATHADVVVLQEITPQQLAGLHRSALWAAYPYRVLNAMPNFHGSAIFTRFPVVRGGPIDVAGSPMIEADLSTPGGPVRIVDVHTLAPLDPANAVRWQAQLAALSRMRAPAGSALILAGDFNATQDHEPLQHLVSSGFRDAFKQAGSWLGDTWPEWSGPTFPVMRLDHVMVSGQFTVMSAQVAVSQGSDHRRLMVQLALPRVD